MKIGVEEEFFVVDLDRYDPLDHFDHRFYSECDKRLPGRVSQELKGGQIELKTLPIAADYSSLREQISENRDVIKEISQEFGLGIMACGTHPTAKWNDLDFSPKERYFHLNVEYGRPMSRAAISALHIHVEIIDKEKKIRIFNQIRKLLPLFLALSASSPFWNGEYTGLSAYRLSVYDELPRTGIPNKFDSAEHFDRFRQNLINYGSIQDGSEFWWDIRPSELYPTLELRIPDACTNRDDAVTLAMLFSCLVELLEEDINIFAKFDPGCDELIKQNRWEAKQKDLKGNFFAKDGFMGTIEECIHDVIKQIEGSHHGNEIFEIKKGINSIISRGTSSQNQENIYKKSMKDFSDQKKSLYTVKEWIFQNT